MRKILLLVVILCISTHSFAFQPKDSIKSDTSQVAFLFDIGIYSNFVWRGVKFGDNVPSFQGAYSFNYKGISVGSYLAVPINGTRIGYGNTLNHFISYSWNDKISVTLDDYFFYEAADTLNDYFNLSSNSQHFIEARLAYTGPIDVMVGYTLISGLWDRTNGVYFEIGYPINSTFYLFLGGVSGASFLNFSEAAGLTNMGFTYRNELNVSKTKLPVFGSVVVNPNYKNISDVIGVGKDPVNFVIGIEF